MGRFALLLRASRRHLTRRRIACPNGGVRSRFASVVSLASLLAACGDPSAGGAGSPAPPASSASAPAATVEITLVGTADLHGRLSALAPLGGYLKALRAKNPDGVLLVDAGDMFQGTLESNLDEGAPVIDAYKKLGYDAVAIGNHEFDYGPVGEASTVRRDAKEGPDRDARGALKARAAQAKGAFPMLAANLLEEGRPLDWPNVAPSVLVTKRGVSIGIIGVSTMSTLKTTIAANVVGVSLVQLTDAITAEAKALRERGAKVVVVAAHAGGHCAKTDVPTDLSSCEATSEIFDVARKLPVGAVQAIVAGHTHKNIAHEVAGIPIIESGSWGAAFGRVDIVVEAATGKVVRTRIHPPETVTAGGDFEGVKTAPSQEVADAVAPAIERAKARRAKSLGTTIEGPFAAKYKDECALGNLVTSLLLELDPKADIALSNGGGLRADLAPGPLTYGALYDVLPFDNRIARLTMTGKGLRETFLKNLHGKSGVLSVAGARVEERCAGGKPTLEIVLTGRKKAERKLGDGDRVIVITNEFLATQGDDFGHAERIEIDEDGPPFREPMAALLEKRGGVLRPEEWFLPGKPRIARRPADAGDCPSAP